MVVKTFRSKKKECFKEFAETINFRISTKYVWNQCKVFKEKWTKVQPTNVNSNLQNSKSINDTLNRICPPWCQTDLEFLPYCNDNKFFDYPFDFAELNSVLDSKKNKSAAGLDGMDYEIIKNLPLKYTLLLIDIFNEMYRNSCYPDSWLNSFVLFIDKPNNRGVRPISLTSSFCKIFESLVKNRLQWYCEHFKILPNNQSGFRKGRSCADNLVDFTLKAEQAMSNKKDLIAVFLDVSSAYDNVLSDILLNKLASIGCSKSLVLFIKFLTHRRKIFTDTLKDEFRFSYKGVPQGGVLSPLLYLIYVKDITEGVPKSVTISQFADDIANFCSFGSVRRSINLVQKSVSIMRSNLNLIGLEF